MSKDVIRKGPAGPAGVGNERKADVRAAQEGNPTDKGRGVMHHEGLKGATAELHAQHPIPYSDHGPHHGTDHHIRHIPLHGMSPSGKYCR